MALYLVCDGDSDVDVGTFLLFLVIIVAACEDY